MRITMNDSGLVPARLCSESVRRDHFKTEQACFRLLPFAL